MTGASSHPAGLAVEALLSTCDVRRQRRSGPGGQHRNKVETGVVITHRPSGLRGEATERRSQEQNRRQALLRLRVNLALGIRTPAADAPSPLWQQHVRGGKITIRQAHADFPALLAEALDVLEAQDLDLRAAAGRLSCTPSQLVRFLQGEPRAFEQLNAARRDRGLHPLKPG